MSSNCKMNLDCFFDKPYLCLFATKNIEKDKELRYDYGDEANMWWGNDVSIWRWLRSCKKSLEKTC